jgi:DNA-binding CsgD family transcriptional regulator/tetratricopeptide (TPR) repeat protein
VLRAAAGVDETAPAAALAQPAPTSREPAPRRFDAGPTPAAPRRAGRRAGALFVGRRPEIARLTSALQSAREGHAQIVALAGSGGIGKTRLAQELASQAEKDGVVVLWGRCLEEPGAPPYWPWRQLVRSYLHGAGDDRIGETLGAGLADIAGIVPEVAEFAERTLGLAAPRETGDSAPARFSLFAAWGGSWRRAARRAPLLLILEDLHWADATSLRLLAFLAAELEDSAVLVVGTYRDTELSRQHPLTETLADLARSSAFQRLELNGLSPNETAEFMAAVGASPSAGFVNAIHERTEGHPLFLEETLRLLIEARAAAPGSSPDDDLRQLMKIPSGVREVIGKRLNLLSVPAGRLLSIAACIGRTFELELLAQLESDKSEEEVLGALEEALAVHLIESVPETRQLRFSHALIRETLYDETLPLRRTRLHMRIGEMLERRHGTEEALVLPQLAYHFSEVGTPAAAAKALDYAQRSASHAVQMLAFEEAVRLYRLALGLAQRHFAGHLARRCELLLALGDAQVRAGDAPSARASYDEAAELARNSGLALPFALAAIGFEKSNAQTARSGEPAVALLLEAVALHDENDPLRVELLARLCRAYIYCDRPEEAKDAHRRAVALARQIGDMGSLYIALASIAAAGYWPDMLHERLSAAREAWAIAEDMNLTQRVMDLLAFYLCDLIRIGDVARLSRVRVEGLMVSQQMRSFYWATVCRHAETLVAINEGRFADAQSWATRALEGGRRVAEEQAVSAYGMQMFCLQREQGRLREALPLLQHFVRNTPSAQTWRPGLALLYAELDMREPCRTEFDALPWERVSGAPTDASSLTTVAFAAEVCVYLGDAARAALLYDVLRGHAGANLLADSAGPCLGAADRILANLASVRREWDVAQAHFEAALGIDRRTGWRVWLAHSLHDYAAMLLRRATTGDADKARALLAEAIAIADAIGMASLAPRIRALATSIGAAPPAHPCGLTERELGVLRLIAMGRNNREIAQVLSISQNTVANHVRSILEKTYTANRTEAAAFAHREGLLNA